MYHHVKIPENKARGRERASQPETYSKFKGLNMNKSKYGYSKLLDCISNYEDVGMSAWIPPFNITIKSRAFTLKLLLIKLIKNKS